MDQMSILKALKELLNLILTNPLFLIFLIIILTYISLIIVIKNKTIKSLLKLVIIIFYLFIIPTRELLTFFIKSFYIPNNYFTISLSFIIILFILYKLYKSKYPSTIINLIFLVIHLFINSCLIYNLSINTSNIYSLLFLSQTFSIFIIIFNILTNTIINILKSDEKVEILKI